MFKKAFLVSMLLLFGLTSIAHADLLVTPESEFDQKRGIFVNRVSPGQAINYKVKVTNIGNTEESFVLHGADVSTSDNGSYQYRTDTDTQSLVGSWFQTKPISATLPPKESKSYSFSLKVPNSLSPGQYIGGIVALKKVKDTSGRQMLTHVNFAYPMQVVLEYNSESAKRNMEIVNLEHSTDRGLSSIKVLLDNQGTILEKPTVSLKVFNSDNSLVLDKQDSMDSFYGLEKGFSVFDYGGTLPASDYKALVSIDYSGQHKEKEFDFTVTTKQFIQAAQAMEDNNLAPEFSFWSMVVKYKWIVIAISFLLLLMVGILVYFILLLRKKSKSSQQSGAQLST